MYRCIKILPSNAEFSIFFFLLIHKQCMFTCLCVLAHRKQWFAFTLTKKKNNKNHTENTHLGSSVQEAHICCMKGMAACDRHSQIWCKFWKGSSLFCSLCWKGAVLRLLVLVLSCQYLFCYSPSTNQITSHQGDTYDMRKQICV